MLNGKKKKKKNKRICQKFHNSLSNFGRYSPQEYAWFFESEYGAYFQERCRLKFLLPYGPMLMKTEKNRKISKKNKILKNKNKQKKNGQKIWWIGTCH